MPIPAQRLACYALTTVGMQQAQRVAAALYGWDVHLYAPQQYIADNVAAASPAQVHSFTSLPALVQHTFGQYTAHVFVGAVGIAVRCIAPYVRHKSQDPAVLVCSEGGEYIISLLSGHWGGANALTTQLAHALGATPIITTATDRRSLPAIDVLAQKAGCVILDWDTVKVINAALLAGQQVQVYDPLCVLTSARHGAYFTFVTALEDIMPHQPSVTVHWHSMPPHAGRVRLALPALHVGVGCRKNVPAHVIIEAVHTSLHQAGLEIQAIAGLASITVKMHEAGLVEAAATLAVPLQCYAVEDVAQMRIHTPSAKAAQIFGVDALSVCEGAALLSAVGTQKTPARLLLPKTCFAHQVTVAVAVAE